MAILLFAAAAFQLYVVATSWNHTGWAAGMFVWSLLPYGAAALLWSRRPGLGIIATGLALALDAWLLYSVRTSSNSTAAISFLWGPIWDLIFIGVIALIGNVVSRLFKSGRHAT